MRSAKITFVGRGNFVPPPHYEDTNILQDKKVNGGHYCNVNHHKISSRRQETRTSTGCVRDVY